MKTILFSILLSVVASKSVTPQLQTITVKVPLAPFDPNAVLLNKNQDESSIGDRIINGNPAADGQFPHANEVRVSQPGSYYSCTGTFLTTSWAITARHCMNTDPEWKPVHVYYGSAARNSPIRQNVGVDLIVTWNSGEDRLDIAVLHHERPITLNQYVGLAQLPPLSMEHSHYEGYVATQAGHGGYKDLQYHQLRMQYISDGCLDLNSPGDRWGICAKPVIAGTSSEGGDSGSPWFIYENGKPTLIGVHWGRGGDRHLGTRMSSLIRTVSDQVGLPLRP